MITAERVQHSGAYIVSALVRESGLEWFYSESYYGYTKRESVKRYRESLKSKGYKLA